MAQALTGYRTGFYNQLRRKEAQSALHTGRYDARGQAQVYQNLLPQELAATYEAAERRKSAADTKKAREDQLALQEEGMEAQAISGMATTAGTLGAAYLMSDRALPAFMTPGAKGAIATPGLTGASGPASLAMGAEGGAPALGGSGPVSLTQGATVTSAAPGATGAGATTAAGAGEAAASEGIMGSGIGFPGIGTIAVGSYMGGKLGKFLESEFNLPGGQKEAGYVGAMATGALIGTMIMPGIGTAVGAVIGGVVEALSDIFSF